jgi:hypothetical protein
VRLTTSSLCAECHEIWEPKPPGTLWATSGLLRDCFTLYVYILLIMNHAPSLGSNTTCYNATSCNSWIFVGDAGPASAPDAGRFIPCTVYHCWMISPSSLRLHCLSHSLSNSIDFVNFKNDFKCLVIRSCLLSGQLIGRACLVAS